MQGRDSEAIPSTERAIARLFAASRASGYGLFCGWGASGPVFSAPEQCALVLGPPRSGKTTAFVVPNVLVANGSVVCISTKRDVLLATAAERARLGPCYLFDPAGGAVAHEGVSTVSWSPLDRAGEWDKAVLAAEAMVGASRQGGGRGESSHWSERAGALLASIFHAAARTSAEMAEVCASIDRREPERWRAALAHLDETVALDVLNGIMDTEAREQSGIWSTASGVLRAYRTQAARESASGPRLPVEALTKGRATLYVTAGAEHHDQLAPIIAGLVRDLRTAAYDHAGRGARPENPAPPLLLVLDELANIAPLHDLPALISEGASQGVLTLACLQDLSQARSRWGQAAEGFFSLFGTKLVLGGIGDRATLELLSMLAGEHDITVRSASRSGHKRRGGRSLQRSVSTRRERRLAPDEVAHLTRGEAFCVVGAAVAKVALSREMALHATSRRGRAEPALVGRARSRDARELLG